MFGTCTIPSTVDSRAAVPAAARQQPDGQVGARAPRTAARRAAARSSLRPRRVRWSSRLSQAATGSGSSSRQTWAISLPQSLERRGPARVRDARARPSRASDTGPARPVRRARVEHLVGLAHARQHVAGRGRSGSTPSITCGSTGPVSAIAGAAVLAERQHPLRRTTAARTPSVSGSACSARARFRCRSKTRRSTNMRAVLVGDLGHRARERLLAGLRAERRRSAPAARWRRSATTSSASRWIRASVLVVTVAPGCPG